jgi:hypothetical protein
VGIQENMRAKGPKVTEERKGVKKREEKRREGQ